MVQESENAYDLNIYVERDPVHVMWNVGVPTLVIMMFSFCSYSLPIKQVGDRITITSTLLLAMMAFQGTIKEVLSPMPYLTATGKWMSRHWYLRISGPTLILLSGA